MHSKLKKTIKAILKKTLRILLKIAYISPIKQILRFFRNSFCLIFNSTIFQIHEYQFNRKLEKKTAGFQTQIRLFEFAPKISIILPVYNTRLSLLNTTMQSVFDQIYTNWQLICIDDASPLQAPGNLIQKLAEKDNRILYFRNETNQGISGASKKGYELSNGEYITLLDHDDLLNKDALYQIVLILQGKNKPDFIYTDEIIRNKFEIWGNKFNYKPDFNETKLLCHNYVNHMMIFSRDLMIKIGGYVNGFDGSQDHELALRASRSAKHIHHISKPIYIWRMQSGSFSRKFAEKCIDSSMKAIHEHVKATEKNVKIFSVTEGNGMFFYHVKREYRTHPLVSILIPFKDQPDLLKNCVFSILEKTSVQQYEILLLNNGSEKNETKKTIADLVSASTKISEFQYNKPFNFSAINNFGVSKAKGEYILLLNNDTQIINEDWLSELLQHIRRTNVGIVGPLLLYPNYTVQHAGLVMGYQGLVNHLGLHRHYNDRNFYNYHLVAECEMSAVTGAALLTSKRIWKEVHGMNENLGVAYNDVDFCLRTKKKGYKIIFTPFAQLFHYESKSRGYDNDTEKRLRLLTESKILFKQWGDVLFSDPYYNSNLSYLSWKQKKKYPNELQMRNQFRKQFNL